MEQPRQVMALPKHALSPSHMTFSQSLELEQDIYLLEHGWVELQIMSFRALEVGGGIIRRERNNVNMMDWKGLRLVVEACNCGFD